MTEIKQKIVPHLWFDKEAKEAANFYCSVFPDSSITNITTLHDTPSGDCDVVSFTLFGQPFMAISADLYSNSMSPSPSWCIATHKKK
jgi:predicted 3-demethylubiquinone-9 3-methyltransferase (glyoxalase superfamily)